MNSRDVDSNIIALRDKEAKFRSVLTKVHSKENKISKDIRKEERFHRNLFAAKGEKDNVSVTEKIEVPNDVRCFIIGHKGEALRSMMESFDVNIVVPPRKKKSAVTTIRGRPKNVEKAKEALKERIEELQDRLLRSFRLTVEVDPLYHPKIIGHKGAVISEFRKEYNVQVKFPKRDNINDRKITITGYENDAKAAKETILKFIQEQEHLYKERVSIDSRCYSLIIGRQGRNLFKIMNLFKVDIFFPRASDPDPDLVVIQGAKDDVLNAKDYLLSLEEQYAKTLKT